MKNLAQDVYRYFVDRIAETNKPLSEIESAIFEKARSLMNAYPISYLTQEDLESKGYDTSHLTSVQMNCLADKLADNYHEYLYWESLESIADAYNIPKKEVATHMRDTYDKQSFNADKPCFATVIVADNGGDSFKRIHISIGNVPEDYKKPEWVENFVHHVQNIDELCLFCEPDNQYGFHIEDFIEFVEIN